MYELLALSLSVFLMKEIRCLLLGNYITITLIRVMKWKYDDVNNFTPGIAYEIEEKAGITHGR